MNFVILPLNIPVVSRFVSRKRGKAVHPRAPTPLQRRQFCRKTTAWLRTLPALLAEVTLCRACSKHNVITAEANADFDTDKDE